MKARQGLSDFDDMQQNRLPNWGFCGRHDPDKPNSQRVGHSICVGMLRRSGDPDVWDGPDEEGPPKPDFKDADYLDGFISQMLPEHKEYIRRVYYKQDVRTVDWLRLNTAIRVLLDMIEANRATVAEMKRRLHGR